jgi:hypothetical protein
VCVCVCVCTLICICVFLSGLRVCFSNSHPLFGKYVQFPPKQTTGRLQLNIPEIYFVTPSSSYSTCGLESEIQLQYSKTGKTLNITFPILFDVLHVVPVSGFCPLTGERGLITLSVGLHYSSHFPSCNATC